MTEEIIVQLQEQVQNLEKRILVLEGVALSQKQEAIKENRQSKNLSVREFIVEKQPKDDVQRTLTIGHYLERYQNIPSFNIKDIEVGFRAAKLKSPININDKINMNIRKGFIMEASEGKDGKRAWTLTDSGEKEVNKGFVK